jgi:hypothetical protein
MSTLFHSMHFQDYTLYKLTVPGTSSPYMYINFIPHIPRKRIILFCIFSVYGKFYFAYSQYVVNFILLSLNKTNFILCIRRWHSKKCQNIFLSQLRVVSEVQHRCMCPTGPYINQGFILTKKCSWTFWLYAERGLKYLSEFEFFYGKKRSKKP